MLVRWFYSDPFPRSNCWVIKNGSSPQMLLKLQEHEKKGGRKSETEVQCGANIYSDKILLMIDNVFLWIYLLLCTFEKLHKKLKPVPDLLHSGPDDLGQGLSVLHHCRNTSFQCSAWTTFRVVATEAQHEQELPSIRSQALWHWFLGELQLSFFFCCLITVMESKTFCNYYTFRSACVCRLPRTSRNGKRGCGNTINILWLQAVKSAHSKIIHKYSHV